MKKGQLEIGITMMVILVFIILLFISLIFYFRFTQESIKSSSEEILDVEYSVLLNTIMNAPEFKCSVKGIDKECLDAVKLVAFKKLLENEEAKNYYSNVFGAINRLSVDVVYPEDEDYECIDDYRNCGKFLIFDGIESGKIYSMPIALYYPDDNEYKIAKLKIQTK